MPAERRGAGSPAATLPPNVSSTLKPGSLPKTYWSVPLRRSRMGAPATARDRSGLRGRGGSGAGAARGRRLVARQELRAEHHRRQLESRREADGQHDALVVGAAHLQAVAGRQRHAGDGRPRRPLLGLPELILDGLDRLAELVDLLGHVLGAAVRHAPEEHRASDDERIEAAFHDWPDNSCRGTVYLDE